MSGTDLADQGNLIKDQNDIAITKSGGEVNGAEFQISSSNRSKLLILDHSSQVIIVYIIKYLIYLIVDR